MRGWLSCFAAVPGLCFRPNRSNVIDNMSAVDIAPESAPSMTDKEREIDQLSDQLKGVGFKQQELDKFEVLLEWLRTGGAKYDDLVLQKYDEEFRGVHMANDVPNGKIVLEIPSHMVMTTEVAKASDICRDIVNSGVSLNSSHSYLACFLIQEKRNPASFWKPYIDILPVDYNNMPILWDETQLKGLEGSFALDKRENTLRSLEREYKNLYRALPKFQEWGVTLKEFIWARTAVITRIFGFYMHKTKTDGLVPMADMLNHKTPKETAWTFDDDRDAFTMTATEDLAKGQQVYDTYGSKCNSRFLVNYGFAIDDNKDDNECVVCVNMPPTVPNYSAKLECLSNKGISKYRSFQIGISHKHDETKKLLSFLRFVHAKPHELALSGPSYYVSVDDLFPLSAENEIAALKTLVECVDEALAKFPTTLEQDNETLKNDSGLTRNQRNCVVMVRGEKEILHHWKDLALSCIPMFEMGYNEVSELANSLDHYTSQYVTSVVLKFARYK